MGGGFSALAVHAARGGPEWARGWSCFALHYRGLAPYRTSGISSNYEQRWVNCREVRGRCGKELLRLGLFPPLKYFRNAA